MTKQLFMIITEAPSAEEEAAFETGYVDRHMPDVLAVPGFTAAQRFRLAPGPDEDNAPARFLTIYEMETDDRAAVMAEVRSHFRPEFINRIDEIVVFHGLDEKNIGAIAKIQLKHLEQRLAKMEMTLDIDDAALQKIAEAGYDPVYGARPLKRAIQQQIENPLSKLILSGKFGPKDRIPVRVSHGNLVFEQTGGVGLEKA